MHPTKALFGLAALGVLGALLWAAVRWDPAGAAHLADWLSRHGSLAAILFVVVRVAGAVAFVPGSIMAIAAGVVFGPIWGAVYNLVASVLGAAAAFGIARSFAPHWLKERLRREALLERLVRGIEAEGWRFVAFVRLVPLFPYNLLNYALGLTPLKWSHYIAASAICMVPGDVAYVYVGHASRNAALGDIAAVRHALLAVAAMALLAYLPRFVRVLRTSGESAESK